jgi:hypothetical protein
MSTEKTLIPIVLLSVAASLWAAFQENELPHFPPKPPTEAARTFRLRPGFRIELVAAEPLLQAPVAIDFDEDGRMYVAEFHEYNQYGNPAFKCKGRRL